MTNYTRNQRLRIDIEVNADYDTDLEHARGIIREAVKALDVSSPKRNPRVVIKRFDDSAIVLEMQFWIESPNRERVWNAQTEAITAIKEAFDREEITIPFPQRTHTPRKDNGFRVDIPDVVSEVTEPSIED